MIIMIANKYKQGEEIRRGAFGAIFRGTYEKTGEKVAIKTDLNQASLKHEVRMINYLYNAGVRKIPSIYWFGNYLAQPCVVMTLYECSLYDYRLNGVPTEEKMAKIMWKILEIIENIHQKFVVHRDIKPHNFMIKEGEIYLIDFGLATFYMGEDGLHVPNVPTDHIIGSPLFVSLRVHEGHRYSRRDDLISLGYVYLWMLGLFIENVREKFEGSPLALDYPGNIILANRKREIIKESMEKGIKHFIEYVYGMLYDEVPKYQATRSVFIL